MKNTMAQRIREVIRQHFPATEFTAADIAEYVDAVSKADKKPIYSFLRDAVRRGELLRESDGGYRLAAQSEIRPAVIQRKMWSLLRSMRLVTIADMVALAGASEGYAKEFLLLLARQEIVRRIDQPNNAPSKWQLIADPVKMPRNIEKAEKLRAIRAAKKKALDQIDAAGKALINATQILVSARMAVNDVPEDTDGDE
jgi:hypothetical protein